MELLSHAHQHQNQHQPVLPEPQSLSAHHSLSNLVASLENATLIAKQLPFATDESQILQAYSSIRNAHQQISDFLDRFQFEAQQEDQKMAEQDDPNLEKVEEGIRDCFLQNKRRKRPLSPSAADRPVEDGVRSFGFDQREHLRSLDLVFQFHG